MEIWEKLLIKKLKKLKKLFDKLVFLCYRVSVENKKGLKMNKIITKEERNEQVINLHKNLLQSIGMIYDLWIRESSNSRTTNLKRLNKWKLTKVKDILERDDGHKYFWIEIESPKGIHKHLFGDHVVKYIKRG